MHGDFMTERNSLVIMAKQPIAGRTKTRLVPPFNPQQAADLFEALMLDTIELVLRIPNLEIIIAFSPSSATEYFNRTRFPQTALLPVDGSNIGECLYETAKMMIANNLAQIVLMNSDGPSLPPEYILQAFALLENNDLVLGPSEDGGYYLCGFKKLFPQLFQGIAWSSARVLSQTLERAKNLELSVALTPIWYDIDAAADVGRLLRELPSLPKDILIHTRNFFQRIPVPELRSLWD